MPTGPSRGPPTVPGDGPRSTRGADQGLDPRLLDRALQPLAELDLGLPREDLLRSRDVRTALLRVVRGQSLVDDLRARARDGDDGLRQLEQRELGGVADVDGLVLAGLGQRDDAADEVVDVAEGSRLAAVAE